MFFELGKENVDLLARIEHPEQHEIIKQALEGHFEETARSILFELSSAQKTQSILAAGSRMEMLYLAGLNQDHPPAPDIANWETSRTVRLPWIDQLTADEVLMLREEASEALPRLRELLATRLASPRNMQDIGSTIDELRDQADEVRSELHSLDLPSERRYQKRMAALAASVVVYGFSSGAPTAAAASLAALLATLAHLRNAEREMLQKAKRLTASPAFVLFKAGEIIEGRKRRRAKRITQE